MSVKHILNMLWIEDSQFSLIWTNTRGLCEDPLLFLLPNDLTFAELKNIRVHEDAILVNVIQRIWSGDLGGESRTVMTWARNKSPVTRSVWCRAIYTAKTSAFPQWTAGKLWVAKFIDIAYAIAILPTKTINHLLIANRGLNKRLFHLGLGNMLEKPLYVINIYLTMQCSTGIKQFF